jgi:hypothetical protein
MFNGGENDYQTETSKRSKIGRPGVCAAALYICRLHHKHYPQVDVNVLEMFVKDSLPTQLRFAAQPAYSN